MLGRIGGEEFAVVLMGSNMAAGRLFAETVRSGYAQAAATDLPSGLRCTASFGVAEAMTGDTLSSLMERADGALYAAKGEGRDRVRVARPAPMSASTHVADEPRRSLQG